MSIREIWTQAHFARLAYENLHSKAARSTDVTFSSIHSFLSHCAMISKLLKAREQAGGGISIGKVLKVSDSSIIHKRKFRNSLEHYDQELKKWIRARGANIAIGTYNVGPKSAIKLPGMVYVSHFDPANNVFTFVNQDFDLAQMYQESQRLKGLSEQWVKDLEAGVVRPPFK